MSLSVLTTRNLIDDEVIIYLSGHLTNGAVEGNYQVVKDGGALIHKVK